MKTSTNGKTRRKLIFFFLKQANKLNQPFIDLVQGAQPVNSFSISMSISGDCLSVLHHTQLWLKHFEADPDVGAQKSFMASGRTLNQKPKKAQTSLCASPTAAGTYPQCSEKATPASKRINKPLRRRLRHHNVAWRDSNVKLLRLVNINSATDSFSSSSWLSTEQQPGVDHTHEVNTPRLKATLSEKRQTHTLTSTSTSTTPYLLYIYAIFTYLKVPSVA